MGLRPRGVVYDLCALHVGFYADHVGTYWLPQGLHGVVGEAECGGSGDQGSEVPKEYTLDRFSDLGQTAP